GILVLRLRNRIAAGGVGRERVSVGDSRDPGEGDQELGLFRAGHVVDVVAAGARAVEYIALGGGVVAHVVVVIARHAAAAFAATAPRSTASRRSVGARRTRCRRSASRGGHL